MTDMELREAAAEACSRRAGERWLWRPEGSVTASTYARSLAVGKLAKSGGRMDVGRSAGRFRATEASMTACAGMAATAGQKTCAVPQKLGSLSAGADRLPRSWKHPRSSLSARANCRYSSLSAFRRQPETALVRPEIRAPGSSKLSARSASSRLMAARDSGMSCRYRDLSSGVLHRCGLLGPDPGLDDVTAVPCALVADQAGAGDLPDEGYP